MDPIIQSKIKKLEKRNSEIANQVTAMFKPSIAIDIEQAIASNAVSPITTTTSDGSGQAVHPSIAYAPNGWNGYYYWMAMSPYPSSNAEYENPEILCSNDGLTWVVPSGLTNPIEPKPSTGYNADPNLCFSKDCKTLYCTFKTNGAVGGDVIKIKSSKDGVNWSPAEIILQCPVSQGLERPMSQSIFWDGKQYVMHYVDIGYNIGSVKSYANGVITLNESISAQLATDIVGRKIIVYASSNETTNGREYTVSSCTFGTAGNATITLSETPDHVPIATDNVGMARRILKRTAVDIMGPWSNPIVCTMSHPANKELYHMEVIKINNQLIMALQIADIGTSGYTGQLYLAKSNDGLTWTVSTNPVLNPISGHWDGSIYKCSILPLFYNNEIRLGLWYSVASIAPLNQWRIGYAEILLNKLELAKNKRDEWSASFNKISPYVIADNFNRADNATSLGTAPTGQTWTNQAGNLGISGGKAYCVSAVNTKGSYEAGVVDHEVECIFDTLGAQLWLSARISDDSNYYQIGLSGGKYLFRKIVAGSPVTINLFDASIVPANGDRAVITCKGDNITVSVYRSNGISDYLVCSYTTTDTFNNTATKVGLQSSNTTCRWSWFRCKAI